MIAPIFGQRAVDIAREFPCLVLRHGKTGERLTYEQALREPRWAFLEISSRWQVVDVSDAEEALVIIKDCDTLDKLASGAAHADNPRSWLEKEIVVPAANAGMLVTAKTIAGILTAISFLRPEIGQAISKAGAEPANEALKNGIEVWNELKPTARVSLWRGALPSFRLNLTRRLVDAKKSISLSGDVTARFATRGDLALLTSFMSTEAQRKHWFCLLSKVLTDYQDTTDILAYSRIYGRCVSFEEDGVVGIWEDARRWVLLGRTPEILQRCTIFT